MTEKKKTKPKNTPKVPKVKVPKANEAKASEAKETKPVKETVSGRFTSAFERRYRQECVPALMKELGLKNIMQVPRVAKVVVNTCLKEAINDFKVLEIAASELASITGQRPVYTKARKSIASFKLREGLKIGACVTLRGARMYEFLNRLLSIALPRVRDFKGVSPKAFDGHGNYTFGVTEQIIFPEINFDKVQKVSGMNITIATTAKNNQEGYALLKALGMPFRKDNQRS